MKQDRSFALHVGQIDTLNLTGLKVAVVGGTGGIGRAFSHYFAERGAAVIAVGQTFRDAGVKEISFAKADLSRMLEARRVARELPVETLDMIIFTTGIMGGPDRELTDEGIERDMAVSYLSRIVMMREAAPRLGVERPPGSRRPRIFVTGYPGSNQAGDPTDLNQERSYSRWTTHMNTVAGNEALVLDAIDRYPKIDVFGLNPGLVKTSIRGNLFGKNSKLLPIVEWLTGFMTVKPESFAARIVPLLVSPELEGRSGAMFNNKAQAILPSDKLLDAEYRRQFIHASQALLARLSPHAFQGVRLVEVSGSRMNRDADCFAQW